MHWQEEDSVSVVPLKNIVDSCPSVVDQICTVKTGKNAYKALAVEVGMYAL